MSTRLRDAGVLAAAASVALGVAACGTAAEPGGAGGKASGKGGFAIGLLLPHGDSPRFEQYDRPLIEKRIKELCGTCTVDHANAQSDVATQQQQMNSMIARGVKVLILDPVDSKALRSAVEKAVAAHIPVLSYDGLADGPVSAYVSYNGRQVGRLQGEALLRAMGTKVYSGQIVMLNGDPAHPNAGWFKQGALSALKGKVRIGKSYDTVGWRPENAYASMAGAIAALGAHRIDGVYCANDGLASGAIAALKAAKVRPLPPVTGQDADLAALQHIVAGEQYMTVYKPHGPETAAAAETAVALGRGEQLDAVATDQISSATTKNIPAVLLTPVSVTARTIEHTVIQDGIYTINQICTPKYRAACERAGLIK